MEGILIQPEQDDDASNVSNDAKSSDKSLYHALYQNAGDGHGQGHNLGLFHVSCVPQKLIDKLTGRHL